MFHRGKSNNNLTLQDKLSLVTFGIENLIKILLPSVFNSVLLLTLNSRVTYDEGQFKNRKPSQECCSGMEIKLNRPKAFLGNFKIRTRFTVST